MQPISDEQLQDKIRAWVKEYGDGGINVAGSGSNVLQALIDHKGFVPSSRGWMPPQINTVGDEVETAVRMMAQTPAVAGESNECFRYAMVLRAYYLTPKYWPEEDRIKALSRIGLSMSRHSYYRYVQLGRAFLGGYFNAHRMALKKSVA